MLSIESLSHVLLGSTLGLSAGISPGPLLALVISETLRYGRKEGIKVALSPLVTDLPIILISLLVLKLLGKSPATLAGIAFAGAVFLAFLGWECLKTQGMATSTGEAPPRSFRKGIVANLLNPHPYLFWITVGTPTVMRASRNGMLTVILFFLAFYFFLTGSKIAVAYLTGRSRSLLRDTTYRWIMRILGLLLLLFAVFFIREGLQWITGG